MLPSGRTFVFSNVGTFTLTVPLGAISFSALIVGGGGSGGTGNYSGGGGGGGGGLYLVTDQAIAASSFTIYVGAGGAAVPVTSAPSAGHPGGDSALYMGSSSWVGHAGAGGSGTGYFTAGNPGGAGGAGSGGGYGAGGGTGVYGNGGAGGLGSYVSFPNYAGSTYGSGGGGGGAYGGGIGGTGGLNAGNGAGSNSGAATNGINASGGGGGGGWEWQDCCGNAYGADSGAGGSGLVLVTFHFGNTAISLNDVSNKFSQSHPIALNQYYSGGSIVAAGALGYPNNIETSVPSSGSISLSNFIGIVSNWSPPGGYMGGIFSGNTNADNLYFGGQIPNGAGWVYRKSNSTFGTFTVPSTVLSPSITFSSWTVYLDMGSAYTYSTDGYGHRSYTYYNDYMKDYGVLVYDNTLGTTAGTVVNPTQIGSVNDGTYGAVNTVPSGTVALIPGHSYSLYYYSGFYMTSDIGYGDVSFGWYNYSYPYYTFSGIIT